MTIRYADCHPDRPVHARGLCNPCYSFERRYGELPEKARRKPALELVVRAERVKAELEAAEGYGATPATWRAVAEHLGVKLETLNRYRIRVRQYAEYQQQRSAVAG